MIVTVFKSLYDKTPSYHHAFTVFERIRTQGPLCGTIATIRESDKDTRDKLKKTLPIICFGGKFKERKKSGLEKASGILMLDFDTGDIQKLRNGFVKKPYTLAAFEGPSGNGHSLKVAIRIPVVKDDEEYKVYFSYLESKLPDLDKSGKDISRATFFSFDENAYINTNATEFNLPKGYIESYMKPEQRLKAICDRITLSAKGESHHAVLAASYTAGGLVAGGMISENVALRALEDAADQRRPNEQKDSRTAIESAFNEGKSKPLYDDDSISQAIKKFVRPPKKVVDVNSLVVSRDSIVETSEMFNKGLIPKPRVLGIHELDEYLVFRNNAFYTITGRRGIGKTTTMWYLFTLDAYSSGAKTLMVLYENDAFEAEQEIIGFLVGNDAKWVYHNQREKYNMASDFFHEHFTVLKIPIGFDFFQIFDAAAQLNSGNKYDRIFIDPAYKVGGMDDYNKVLDMAGRFTPFSREVMSLWISNHPTSMVQRSTGQPRDVDAQHGALFSMAADYTLILDRENKSVDESIRSTMNLTIDKVRSKKIKGGEETYSDCPIKLEYQWKKHAYRIWVPSRVDGNNYSIIENPLESIKTNKSKPKIEPIKNWYEPEREFIFDNSSDEAPF